MSWCSNNIYRNNCSNKNAWYNHQRIFVPTIIVGTVVPTMIVETAVSTRVVETAAKDILVPAIIVWTIVPTEIVGTAVPTIIVLTVYYWKSCVLDDPVFHLEKKMVLKHYILPEMHFKAIFFPIMTPPNPPHHSASRLSGLGIQKGWMRSHKGKKTSWL